MRHSLAPLALALLAVVSPSRAPAGDAAPPRATVRVTTIEPPALTRLAWGTVNLLVFADTVDGVHVWVATAARDPRTRRPIQRREFVGRFDPAAIERWSEYVGAVIHARQPAANDTATYVGATLVERDSAVAGIVRRRVGDRLDPRVLLYFSGSDRRDPLVVESEPKDALAFADGVLRAAAASLVRHPDSAATGGVYHDNPIDTATCAVLLSQPRPRYPERMQRAGRRGEVWARFVVDSTGRVDPESFEALLSDDVEFTTEVRGALRGTRFRPATRHGRPVAARVWQRFIFDLAP